MCLWLLTKALVLAAYVHHVLQYNESLDHLQLTVCSRSGNDVNIPDSLPTLRQTKHHNNAYSRTISIWCWLLSFFRISLRFNPWWNHRAAVNYLASVIMPQAKTAQPFSITPWHQGRQFHMSPTWGVCKLNSILVSGLTVANSHKCWQILRTE